MVELRLYIPAMPLDERMMWVRFPPLRPSCTSPSNRVVFLHQGEH